MIKKAMLNWLQDFRLAVILLVWFLYLSILIPVVFVGTVLNYFLFAILAWDWQSMRKIFKKTKESVDNLIATWD